MEDSGTTQQVVDTTQQVTSKTPATRQKNPKRVAAGKANAAKTKKAREEQLALIESQKKDLIEAQSIIAINQLTVETPAVETPAKNVLTTTQWLSVISIVVSLAGIYYKREEIKGVLTPKKPQVNTPPPVVDRAHQEKVSYRWIKHLILFYKNVLCFIQSCRSRRNIFCLG